MKLFEILQQDRRNIHDREVMYDRAKKSITELDRISGPALARKMQISIELAYRLLDEMEKDKIVGPADLNGKRNKI